MTPAHRPLTDETRGYRKDMQPGYVPVAQRKMTKRAMKTARRKAQVLAAIRSKCAKTGGIPPTVREICEVTGLCSAMAQYYQVALEKDGILIDLGEGRHPRFVLREVVDLVRAALGGDK